MVGESDEAQPPVPGLDWASTRWPRFSNFFPRWTSPVAMIRWAWLDAGVERYVKALEKADQLRRGHPRLRRRSGPCRVVLSRVPPGATLASQCAAAAPRLPSRYLPGNTWTRRHQMTRTWALQAGPGRPADPVLVARGQLAAQSIIPWAVARICRPASGASSSFHVAAYHCRTQ